MFDFDLVHQHLGPLAMPLITLSVLVCAVLFEKILVLGWFTLRRAKLEEDALIWPKKKTSKLTAQGLELLMVHAQEDKSLREEIAQIWIQMRKRKLNSGIRLLQVIAVLAPLLGLLGTVLGLIKVFDDLSLVTGAIEPSMLAEGLGLAMHTTAAGLLIALPALAGAHGFLMWIDHIIGNTEHVMNQMNLMIQGIDIDRNSVRNDIHLSSNTMPPKQQASIA